MRRSRPTLTFAASVVAFALMAAGCGGEEHPNEPRSPKPIEVTAKVDDEAVTVSPNEFGAGLAVFTISNQTDDVVQLTLDGPQRFASDPIEPLAVEDNFKVPLEEGEYEVRAGEQSDARKTVLVIGPERPSSQDELLLP